MIAFDARDLAKLVEALSDEERNALPFGAIRLSPDWQVVSYNQTEARQSGMKGRPTIGLSFFTDIAPCMNTPEMRGRIEAARRNGTIDFEMGWVGDFSDADRELHIRVQSASDGGAWLFISRADG